MTETTNEHNHDGIKGALLFLFIPHIMMIFTVYLILIEKGKPWAYAIFDAILWPLPLAEMVAEIIMRTR